MSLILGIIVWLLLFSIDWRLGLIALILVTMSIVSAGADD